MRRFAPVVALAAILVAAPPASAQVTRCAACHLANLAHVPGAEHVSDWQRSAHAKHNVGCQECHGGNPWSFEPREAHRGILHPSLPTSPVNRLNLVETCARCHQRIALAFSTTLHATLVQLDERRAPTCTTCHGVMSARVPSPATLESRCGVCHPAGSARGDYPARMREAIEALNAQRERADALQDEVERLSEYSTRVTLLVALIDTRTVLNEAVAAVHRIDPQSILEQSAAARRRLDVVDGRLTSER